MANAIRIKTTAGWQDMAWQGPQGPAGTPGATGPQGPAGTPGNSGNKYQFLPQNALAQTFDRRYGAGGTTTLAPVTGALNLYGITVPAATTIATAWFHTAATVPASVTHSWTALYDRNLNRLRLGTDDTSGAWSASSWKSLALASAYTTGVNDEDLYIGLCVTATTMPNFNGITLVAAFGGSAPPSGSTVNGYPPTAVNAVASGLTVPSGAPDPAPIAGIGANLFYIAVGP